MPARCAASEQAFLFGGRGACFDGNLLQGAWEILHSCRAARRRRRQSGDATDGLLTMRLGGEGLGHRLLPGLQSADLGF
jgi:hypothetical protein